VRPLDGIYILFVDDNEDARDLAKTGLEYDGAVVEVAATAAEAMVKLAIMLPDVIVTDLTMPRIDGYAFLAELKQSPALRGIPVIAVTGVTVRGLHGIGRASGFTEYLVKPIDPDVLTAVIRRVITRQKSQ
jgi:CheY-like chemotaxis protein